MIFKSGKNKGTYMEMRFPYFTRGGGMMILMKWETMYVYIVILRATKETIYLESVSL